MRTVRLPAFAKVNLALEILGTRQDGYHELRTIFQTIALHDTLTLSAVGGPFEIRCDDPACPSDQTNLIWRAAEALWHAAGRKGAPVGVRVRLKKRIPLQAGLGGGSSDAATALRALATLWRTQLSVTRLTQVARTIGADVPFFLRGGTALGSGRGDRLRPLRDWPSSWIVLALPAFGVSTRDAYSWWDEENGNRAVTGPSGVRSSTLLEHLSNDLERVVAARNPEIASLAGALRAAGALHAAMSGSGSTVFGLFRSRREAESAARALATPSRRAMVTRTLDRAMFDRRSRIG